MTKFITFTKQIFEHMSLDTLREIGRQMGVASPTTLSKPDLEDKIMGIQAGTIIPEPLTNRGRPSKSQIDLTPFIMPEDKVNYGNYSDVKRERVDSLRFSDKGVKPTTFMVEGVLETLGNYGFLRVNNYENSEDDAYISIANIRKFNLRRGDKVSAIVKIDTERNLGSPAVQTVVKINDFDPDLFLTRKVFDDLVPTYPTERINLEQDGDDVSLRIIDLFAPIGKGQRGLIVAPPKTGKTTLIKNIAKAIETNHPEIKLFVLLIDERPEEVTDIKKSVKGEVVFSTFDESPLHHVKASELVINRAKRLVEAGMDVVILMDSITRLTRAYNNTIESSGKVLTGGIDPMALQGPKRFFGSARNIEDGGSLTILSTALVDTGSRMDDVIYEEFKGTGNMEIHLSRDLSERRIFPAIDLYKSGTRKDELLLSKDELSGVVKLRKVLSGKPNATEILIDTLAKSKSNSDIISKLDEMLEIYGK
ncbi:MAG: transcription termination factor Rho [Clostridiales bacterium]|nr:transcription termination factor Rho [Clostridiales bacterium]